MSTSLLFFLCLVGVFGLENDNFGLFKLDYQKGNWSSAENLTHFGKDNLGNSTSVIFRRGSIPSLAQHHFGQLDQLQSLKMKRMNVSVLETNCFGNLPGLKIINLADNNLKSIKSGVFNNLQIDYLYLQRNRITTMAPGCFKDMPQLKLIHINHNLLATWDSAWFNNVPMLQALYFRRNDLQIIPTNAFKFLQTKACNIFLSRNNISIIQKGAFNGLSDVKTLALDRNWIPVLDLRILEPIQTIDSLSMVKSRVRKVEKQVGSTKIQELVFRKNPIGCLPPNAFPTVAAIKPPEDRCKEKLRKHKKKKHNRH